jgi:hypothetical protein
MAAHFLPDAKLLLLRPLLSAATSAAEVFLLLRLLLISVQSSRHATTGFAPTKNAWRKNV